ncbi:MAG: hypothetical protein LBM00_02975 [Deltaproteobacteria bacterium]|jgi:hypothetical protein|nr:hypothetical protein [Deltaproteobacteria bacterium]
MTLENTQIKQIYLGNGAATEFPVPFKYDRVEDLYLLLTDDKEMETPLAENFRVAVTPAGDTSVIYPVSGLPLPPGWKFTIFRDTPETQIVDLIHGGAFNPDVLEHDALDRIVMMIQEIEEAIERALKVPLSSDKTPEQVMAEIMFALEIVRMAKEYLDQMERLLSLEYLESGVYNVRRVFVAQQDIPVGGTLTLPVYYYPTRNVLFLTYEDTPCVPKIADVDNAGVYQYREVGTEPNVPSNQVTLDFSVKAGEKFDVWIVTSAFGKNLDAQEALVDQAAGYVGDAAESAASIGNSVAKAAQSAASAKDSADRAEAALNTTTVVVADRNERTSWICSAAIPSGTVITIPDNVTYFPGTHMLHLAYNGAECNPAQPGLTEKQYEEVGEEGEPSGQLKLLFDAEAGAVFSVWVLAFNAWIVRQDALEAAEAADTSANAAAGSKDAAAASAQRAEDFADNAYGYMNNAADSAAAAETTVADFIDAVGGYVQVGDSFSVKNNAVVETIAIRDIASGTDSEVDVYLPIASEEAPGVMSKESYAQIQQNTADIASLAGRSTRYVVHMGTAQVTNGTVIQAAYEAAAGVDADTEAPDATTLVNLDEYDGNGAEYTWYESNSSWQYRGGTTLTIATESTLGGVKSSSGIAANNGKILVESDGTMSLLGYDALAGKTGIMTSASNGIGRPDGTTLQVDAGGKLSASMPVTTLTDATAASTLPATTSSTLAALLQTVRNCLKWLTARFDSSGNANAAVKLTTARTIGGVSFDGSANINLPGVNAAGNQATSGNAGTATKLATARSLKTKLDSTTAVTFDGSAAQDAIPVTGTLSIGNGGTAATTAAAALTSLGAAPANATLTDATAADTLPATTSSTLAALLQTVRNCLKSLYSKAFGVNQKWAVKTSDRTAGVAYTNTQGKMMQVTVTLMALTTIPGGHAGVTLYSSTALGGGWNSFSQWNLGTGSVNGARISPSILVEPGKIYALQLNELGTYWEIISWHELVAV